jgi:probable F420-dependent oxidoreductase
MKIGLLTGFGWGSPPDLIATTGQLAEQAGVHSLWAPEHVVFFENHDSRYPYSQDGKVPGRPQGVLDPFSTLTFLAASTSRIRLGTGICLVPQRNPVYTARLVADVDYLSGGRFDFGVGIGWQREEFEALDVPWERRAARTRDYLEVMKHLWSDPVPAFEGEFYSLPECIHGPKPVQKPHPPIFFGGESEPALRRVAEVGQGWFGFDLGPEELAPHLKSLDAALGRAGRTRADLQIFVSPYMRPIDRDMVKRYQDLDVDQVITPLFARDRAQVERQLEALPL